MATSTNRNTITFPTPTNTWSAPTHVALFDASSSGNELVRVALTGTVSAPQANTVVSFAASALTFTQATDSTLLSEGSLQMMRGLFDSTVYVALLRNGTELSGNAYARVSVTNSGWTVAA